MWTVGGGKQDSALSGWWLPVKKEEHSYLADEQVKFANSHILYRTFFFFVKTLSTKKWAALHIYPYSQISSEKERFGI